MEKAAQPGEAAVGDVSKLLCAWSDGDQSALERLTPIDYDKLHRIAGRYMKRERTGHGLQTTDLVNEAYVREGMGAHRSPDLQLGPSFHLYEVRHLLSSQGDTQTKWRRRCRRTLLHSCSCWPPFC